MSRFIEYVGSSLIESKTARADEFTLQEEDGWVHILDGEQSVRLSMPVDVWKQLIQNYLKK